MTKISVFAFSLLKDVPLSFIAEKICFGTKKQQFRFSLLYTLI